MKMSRPKKRKAKEILLKLATKIPLNYR